MGRLQGEASISVDWAGFAVQPMRLGSVFRKR
jgi:hypothetical protein